MNPETVPVKAVNLTDEIERLRPSLIAMRRDLHRHPELGFEEHRTSNVLASHLESLGLEVIRGVAKTGIIARLIGKQPGKTILIRADIDALPIHEDNEVDYASTNPGVMHACGHDGHAAIAAHLATLLTGMRDKLKGEVRFAFQPAEETAGGALAMIEAGALEGVDLVVGLHLMNVFPIGTVAISPGAVMAAPDSFTITVQGHGGHAAMPHRAIDPILVGAQIVLALQSLVSRETDPLDSSVVTIASLNAGNGTHNVIPETAELKGTLRTFKQETRERLTKRIKELTVGIGTAMGAQIDIDWRIGPPPVVNDPMLSERMAHIAQTIVEPEHVLDAQRMMGSEDMAEFLSRRPGVYFFVGSANAQTGQDQPHHHPRFDFDERALSLGLELLAHAVFEFQSIPKNPA